MTADIVPQSTESDVLMSCNRMAGFSSRGKWERNMVKQRESSLGGATWGCNPSHRKPSCPWAKKTITWTYLNKSIMWFYRKNEALPRNHRIELECQFLYCRLGPPQMGGSRSSTRGFGDLMGETERTVLTLKSSTGLTNGVWLTNGIWPIHIWLTDLGVPSAVWQSRVWPHSYKTQLYVYIYIYVYI